MARGSKIAAALVEAAAVRKVRLEPEGDFEVLSVRRVRADVMQRLRMLAAETGATVELVVNQALEAGAAQLEQTT